MSNLIVFDSDVRDHLLPLTFSRPVGDLRVGILTIREKWERYLRMPSSFLPHVSLRELYPSEIEDDNILVNGSVLPTPALAAKVLMLSPGEALRREGVLVAARLAAAEVESLSTAAELAAIEGDEFTGIRVDRVNRPGDIFSLNDTALRDDYELVTAGRTSQALSATNTIIGPEDQLFIAEGATVEACVINVTSGPVYIGRDAVVLEGCLLRGPISVGEGAVLKMGAKIYGATTIGPRCKAGGEINNVVFHSNSNKGHDGFLGNAVIGRWCNIGADTNASNLKNDYGTVRVWSYVNQEFVDTGRQFHGLIMGDHSKLGINTMINTGTVIGFSANVFGEGFPRTFIPSFSWGGRCGLHDLPVG